MIVTMHLILYLYDFALQSTTNLLHTMEIDTGASVSVISKTTYQREFNEYELQGSSVHLTTYGGEPLSVFGEIVIDVAHGDNKAKLPLLVVDKDGPSLLGRNWLACFHLDWNVIHKVQESKLSNILDKYKTWAGYTGWF